MFESVGIHDKHGNIICNIYSTNQSDEYFDGKYLQKLGKDNTHIEWWAWKQARNINVESNKFFNTTGTFKQGDKLIAVFQEGSLGVHTWTCIVCKKPTIELVHKTWQLLGYIIKDTIIGFACFNTNCPMRKIVIPKILIQSEYEANKPCP